MPKKLNTRGQVTIYIIIAIILIAVVALFFVFRSQLGGILGGEEKNPDEFLSGCLEERINDVVIELGHQGGSLNPTVYKNFKFEDENKAYKISYLCYNVNNYLPCVNQQPNLVGHVADEIKTELGNEIESCFTKLKKSYTDAGYEKTETGENTYEIKVTDGKIIINYNQKLQFTKGETTKSFNNLNAQIKNNIYEFLSVTNRIVNDEATNCEFDVPKFIINNPGKNIGSVKTQDGSTIYTINNRGVGGIFRFAVKGGGCLRLE